MRYLRLLRHRLRSLLRRDAVEDEAEIGRSRVSVLMAQHRFDPGDPELPLIEQARTALADNRKVATEAARPSFTC